MSIYRYRYLIIIAITLFSSFGFSDSLPRYCFTEAVKKIRRPVLNGDSRFFDYRYSVSPGSNPELPVVIFIPGGPGQTSMEMPLSIPTDFTLVRTDPRSMGCNAEGNFPPESLSSRMIAEDIIALIRDLNPRKYILYGISYGTIVATMVASLADKEEIASPTALVLEGTIGRAFKEREYFETTLKRWAVVKKSLPDSVQQILAQPVPPLGLSSKQWAVWLSTVLIQGVLPVGEDYAVSELKILDPARPEGPRQGLLARIKKMSEPPLPEKVMIYKEIACREIATDIRDIKYDFDWEQGDLVVGEDRFCADTPFTNPFDAKNFPVTSPIYYFTGTLDPITPEFQVRYHFESQKNSKYRIAVADGGHHALATNLADCSDAIWMAIGDNDIHQLQNVLSNCAAKEISLVINEPADR